MKSHDWESALVNNFVSDSFEKNWLPFFLLHEFLSDWKKKVKHSGMYWNKRWGFSAGVFHMRERFPTIKLRHHQSTGLRAQASCWASISIILYAGAVVRGGLLEHRWIVITRLQRQLCCNTTAATCTAVVTVFQTAGTAIYPPWSNTRKPFSRNSGRYNSAPVSLLPRYREMRVWRPKNARSSDKTRNENLPPPFWSVPRQNKVTASPTYENAHRAYFGKQWRLALTLVRAYLPPKTERADPEVHARAGEAREKHSSRGQSGVCQKILTWFQKRKKRVIVEWCD